MAGLFVSSTSIFLLGYAVVYFSTRKQPSWTPSERICVSFVAGLVSLIILMMVLNVIYNS